MALVWLAAGIAGAEVSVLMRKDGWMRALQFAASGGPELLTWGEAPEPHAGPGQVWIAAPSVNPIDWKTLSGALAGGQPMVGTG